MLERDFQLPDPVISKQETKKRIELAHWFAGVMRRAVTGFIVTGSMAYGQNHSVKQSSDIDIQLLVTPQTVDTLLDINLFDLSELKKAIEGYKLGLYDQFSLVFERDGVSMECHFWDEGAFIDAIAFKSETTERLRSSIDTPSTDYGYSFDRTESKHNYYGEMKGEFPVSDFPSYRRVGDKLYLCRPITNILGAPWIVIENPKVSGAIEECWDRAVSELVNFAGTNEVDLNDSSLINTLPGKNKISPEVFSKIQEKTSARLVQLSQN